MANRKIVKAKKVYRAKLLNEEDTTLPCIFCKREVDDEVIYGKIYAIGDVQCHYFCALLSCCLIQKGRDDEGLFGFLYRDILAEVERCKKHKCSYCGHMGANLGCSVSQCRKQFHLPCGREKNAVTMFYGNFKSYCQLHAPKQQISEHVMLKARQRMPKKNKNNKNNKESEVIPKLEDADPEWVCVICYERVSPFPAVDTFWPPCCGKDAWFHRSCLQRMALSAGMHYLKCPLCNDKEAFYEAVLAQGYYIPDRDAAWELEQNAFQEIYSRVLTCSLDCCCPNGTEFDSDGGPWDIMPCGLCGAVCAHLGCFTNNTQQDTKQQEATFVCETCETAAGEKLGELLENVQKLIQQEQAKANASNPGHRRIMPSRMSLRRTKPGAAPQPSTSRHPVPERKTEEPSNTTVSRLELNLRTPRRRSLLHQIPTASIENNLLSPLKLLEQGLNEKMANMNIRDDICLNNNFLINILRQKFAKPKPLSEKRRIINDILDGLLRNQLKDSPKSKNPVREWYSPQKRSEPSVDMQKTPEKETDSNATNIQIASNSIKKPDQMVYVKEESSPIKDEPPVTANSLLKNLLTEIDNRKHSRIESLFNKANCLIDRHKPKVVNKPLKVETIDGGVGKDETNDASEERGGILNVKTEIVDQNDDADGKNDQTNADNGCKEEKLEKCALKFSSRDKERLWNRNLNIDLETFKNNYLNEVSNCKFGHKHSPNKTFDSQLRTAIDFAKSAAHEIKADKLCKKDLKRKSSVKEKKKKSKRNRLNSEVLTDTPANKEKATKKLTEKSQDHTTLKEKDKKQKNNGITSKKTAQLSYRDKNVKLKIKIREQGLKLKISNRDSENRKQDKFKDTPRIKKKHIKANKTPDNMKQTSIQDFFTNSRGLN